MKKLKVRGSWIQFVEPLRNLESFDTHGSLRGARRVAGKFHTQGALPPWYAKRAPEDIDYVVYSYDTPIAWHSQSEGWYVPDEAYSITTTTQQGRIRTALSML